MSEKESIADITARVQKKLTPQRQTPKPNPFPILEKSTVHHTPDENITVHGVAPKKKK